MYNPNPILEFQRKRNFSEKISATFEYLKQNFKSLSRCLLFIAGPPVVLSGIFIGDIFGRFMGFSMAQSMGGGTDEMQEYFSSSTFWLQLAGILVFAWIGGVITIATTYGHMRVYNEKKSTQIEVSEVWACVRDTFWLHFWTVTLNSFLTGVVLMILAIPLFLIIGLATVLSPVFAILGILGFYAVAGVVIIDMSLIYVIRENERISFFDGISRLIYLIKDKIWSTFGVGLITILVHSVVSSLFLIPWYVIFVISTLHSMDNSIFDEPSGALQTVGSVFLVLYFIASTLLYALPLIGLAFQYYNLVERREARGLMQDIENFGQTSVQPPADEHY